MALFTQTRALFYDEKGMFHGRKMFSKHDKTFRYGNKAYNVDLKNGSEYEYRVIPLLLKRRDFTYNIAYSNPYDLRQFTKQELQELLDQAKKNSKEIDTNLIVPPITPELYDINLETKVATELNDLSKGKFKLNWKIALIGIVALIIIWYFASGHTLAQLTGAAKPSQLFLPLAK